METTIKTVTYEEALSKALEMGFQVAQIYGISAYIEEMLEDCRKEPTGEFPADWIIVGNVLCRTGDIWQENAEVYYLH